MKYSNEQLRNILAENGKVLTENQRQKIADMQSASVQIVTEQYERTQPEATLQKELSRLERWLMDVPAVVNFIADIGNTLTTITQAIIPASLPVLLVLLIFAEAERVRYGVKLFEVHEYLAVIVAYILVIGNAFVELAIQHKHQIAGYERSTGYQFSFRILAARLAYIFGLGDWQPKEKSPALRLERLQSALTSAILFLAIGGSMTDTIMQQNGNWRDGLVSIAVDSSLLELLTWLSGLVAAVVIVLLAQAIVAYAYGRASEYYHELLDRREAADGSENPEYAQWQRERAEAIREAREQAERELLLKALASKGIELDQPTIQPALKDVAVYQNGNGNHS